MKLRKLYAKEFEKYLRISVTDKNVLQNIRFSVIRSSSTVGPTVICYSVSNCTLEQTRDIKTDP